MSDNSAPYRNDNLRFRSSSSIPITTAPQLQMLERDGRDSRAPTSNDNLNLNQPQPQPPPLPHHHHYPIPPPPGMLPLPPYNINSPTGHQSYFSAPYAFPPPPVQPPLPIQTTHQHHLDPNALDNWQYYPSSAAENTGNTQSNNMNRNYSNNPNNREYMYPNSGQSRQHSTGRSPTYSPNNNAHHGNVNSNYNRGGNRVNQHSSAPTQRSRPSLRKLGSIPPIRDALNKFTEESPIISRFSQFCADSSRTVPLNRRRGIIHEFSGFTRNDRPRVEVLLYLHKNDLDTLAWALGVPRGGRKSDVATRIADTLKAPLQWRMPTSTGPGNSMTVNTNGSGYAASSYGATAMSNSIVPQQINHNLSRGNVPAIPQSAAYGARNRAQPKRKGNRDVQSLVRDTQFMTPETPFNLPLDKPLGFPGRMMFTSQQLSSGMVEPKVSFLSPDLHKLEVEANAKGKGVIQVHLRCLKIEIGKPVEQWAQSWPFPCAAKVNGSNVELDQAQRFTNGKLAGTDKATNITPYLRKRKDSYSANTVAIRRSANSCATTSGSFVIFAQPILVQNITTMADIVKENTVKYWADYRQKEVMKGMNKNATDFEMGRRQVEHLMSGGDGFAVASQKVSLKCPLSLVPISTPVRGKDCTHIQCFDLTNYLDFTRRSTKFNCPVCNKKDASPSSLIISWFIDCALKKFAGCDEVEVLSDGSIKAVQNVRTGVASNDSDSDDDGPPAKKYKANGAGASNGKGSAPASKAAVVDLTLDSDEELPPSTAPVHSSLPPSLPPPPPPTPLPARLAPPPEPVAPPIPVNPPGEQQYTRDGENWINEANDGDDFEFDVQFNAEDAMYPWELASDTEKNTEEEDEKVRLPPLDETQPAAAERNDQNQNSSLVFMNGIEVITIDD